MERQTHCCILSLAQLARRKRSSQQGAPINLSYSRCRVQIHSAATSSLGAAERNYPLGVNPFPIVQLLSWSLRCRNLGRPEQVDTEGGSQEIRPLVCYQRLVSLASMGVQAASRTLVIPLGPLGHRRSALRPRRRLRRL